MRFEVFEESAFLRLTTLFEEIPCVKTVLFILEESLDVGFVADE